MSLLVDTGSSWIWVASESCLSQQTDINCYISSEAFHPSSSLTLERTKDTKSIKYGTLQVEGAVVHDNVRFAPIGPVVDQMPFIMVDYIQNFPFFGIIGLAPKDDSAGPLFIDYLIRQKKIREPQFALLLVPDQFSSDGRLTIGGFDRESDRIFKTPLAYDLGYSFNAHRIAGSFHWELKFNGFGFNGVVHRAPHTRVMTDSGTDGILMPGEMW
jgi:hypothetical protein